MYTKLALLAILAVAVLGGRLHDKSIQDKKLFCGACKDVFKEIKKYLPEGEPLTKEVVKRALDLCCDEIPVVSGLCKEGVNLAIDELFDYIVHNADHIDPEHICKSIKLC